MRYAQLTPPRLAGYIETSGAQGTTLKVRGKELEVRPMKHAALPMGVIAIRGRWTKQGGKNKSEVKWLVLLPWWAAACDGQGEIRGAALYEGYMPGRLSWGEGLDSVLTTPETDYATHDDPVGVRWGWLTWKKDGEKTSPLWTPHPMDREDIWTRFVHVHAQHSRDWLKARASAAEVRGWLAMMPEIKSSAPTMDDDAPLPFGLPPGLPPGLEGQGHGQGFGLPPGPYSQPPDQRAQRMLEEAARRSAAAGEQGPPPARRSSSAPPPARQAEEEEAEAEAEEEEEEPPPPPRRRRAQSAEPPPKPDDGIPF